MSGLLINMATPEIFCQKEGKSDFSKHFINATKLMAERVYF
jgi:hypothetical protein